MLNRIFHVVSRKREYMHHKFIKAFVQFALTVVMIVVVFLQFTSTKELTSVVMAWSGLLVAIAGFAAQQTLSDVIAGFMLSWSRPYNLNERVTLVNSNITGIVEGITMRHTIIRLFDNNRLIIPNSVINREVIKNSNYEGSKIGNFVEIEISYTSDIDLAIHIISQIMWKHPLVVDKENISILIKDFSSNGIILKTTVWTKDVNDNFRACHDIRMQVLKDFAANKIFIPYQHTVILDGGPADERP
jgi:small-conductance mechanosensitive channel